MTSSSRVTLPQYFFMFNIDQNNKNRHLKTKSSNILIILLQTSSNNKDFYNTNKVSKSMTFNKKYPY